MSFQYKIGEISALLGISPETLRFYEKRGLLQPEKSPHNGYRSYSQNDLYRLLDIIFYRRLDLGLDDIRHLLTTDDLTAITQLLAEQQEALEQKIARETLTLKKLETVRRSWQQIPQLLGRFVCQALQPAYILLENQPAGDTLQRFSILSQEHLELSQFLEPLALCADHWQRTDQWLVIMDCALAAELGLASAMHDLPKLSFPRCWQTIVSSACGQDTLEEAASSLYAHVLAQHEQLSAPLYCVYLCSSTENGQLMDYYTLYAPV